MNPKIEKYIVTTKSFQGMATFANDRLSQRETCSEFWPRVGFKFDALRAFLEIKFPGYSIVKIEDLDVPTS